MSVRQAIRLTTLATIVSFVLSFISVIVVSRLLSPEDIGIFSVAVSVIAYTHILREFGVGQYFVQLKELSREHLRTGFTVMLMISWSIALGLFTLRTPLAEFYRHDGLASVFAALTVNFIILPFGSPILSMLKREMRFDRLAIVGIASSVVQVSVTIGTAMAGESYMSMAWGSIAGNITNVILLSAMRPDIALLMPTRKGLVKVLSFGSKSSAGALVGELGTSGPDLILGKTLGFAAVATYSRAASLNNMLLGKVNEIVRHVFLPAFAQGIRDGQSPANMYYDSMRLITGITVPLLSALAVLANPMILFFFGPQWNEAGALALFLCLYQVFRAPTEFAANALVAAGHAGTVLRCEAISQGAVLGILLLSIWLDLDTVVYLLPIASCIHFVTFGYALQGHYGLTHKKLLSSVLPSYKLIPGTIMGSVALEAIIRTGAWQPSPLVHLAVSSSLAAVGYVVTLRLSGHPVREELIRLVPPLAKVLGHFQGSTR